MTWLFRSRTRVATMVLAVVTATIVIVVVLVSAGSTPRLSSRIVNSSGNPHVSLVDNVISPTTTSTCGSWATNSADPTESAIVSAHGTILYCQLIGYTWVVITSGIFTSPSTSPSTTTTFLAEATSAYPPPNATWQAGTGIGIFNCSPSDTSCLNGSTEQPYSNFTFNPDPVNGIFHVIGFPGPTELQVEIGANQYYFNTQSGVFSSSAPSEALYQCWQSWGAYLGSQGLVEATATVVAEQAFESSNPQCLNP